MLRRRLIVSGKVQGVYFRDGVRSRRQVELRNLVGWARNLADGRVEVVLEGEDDMVEEVIEWCGVGPPRAVVTGIEIFDEEIRGESGFEIR